MWRRQLRDLGREAAFVQERLRNCLRERDERVRQLAARQAPDEVVAQTQTIYRDREARLRERLETIARIATEFERRLRPDARLAPSRPAG